MSIMNQDFNQQQYNDKLAQVASLAVTYAKDGTGYHSMKDAFNELCEISHANKGIDQENTIGRRTLLVQRLSRASSPAFPQIVSSFPFVIS